MHASELLYVAAAVANNADSFVRTPLTAASASLHQYWTASRERLDNWSRALAQRGRESFSPAEGDDYSTSDVGEKDSRPRSVIEEILLAEVLTRVWAAASMAHDEHQRGQILAPLARSIFLGHQESRNRALKIILQGHGLTPREVRRLNVLRQKCERWTDLFLAQIPLAGQTNPLAFDADRLADFAEDLAHEMESGTQQDAHRLTMASLAAAARRGITRFAANGELNQKIAGGVLGCLPADALDASGHFTSLWQTRIENTTSDTMSMVAELLSLD